MNPLDGTGRLAAVESVLKEVWEVGESTDEKDKSTKGWALVPTGHEGKERFAVAHAVVSLAAVDHHGQS